LRQILGTKVSFFGVGRPSGGQGCEPDGARVAAALPRRTAGTCKPRRRRIGTPCTRRKSLSIQGGIRAALGAGAENRAPGAHKAPPRVRYGWHLADAAGKNHSLLRGPDGLRNREGCPILQSNQMQRMPSAQNRSLKINRGLNSDPDN
jgi:hypothetical protein